MRELARLGIGEVLAWQGRYGEARDFMEWTLEALGAVGNAARQASALASLIRLYTTLGRRAGSGESGAGRHWSRRVWCSTTPCSGIWCAPCWPSEPEM